MKVELRDIEAIRPYESNPRLNDQAVEAVAKSLREFGFRQPVVVDADGVIICGHTRWKAAQKLGIKQVPVHVATDLSPAQVRAFRIADNATADIATWNYELLPLEIRDLQGMDFDLSLLGFDETALAELLAPAGNEGLTDPDAVPLPGDAAITQPGDLWILGNHRLLCGDASEAQASYLLTGESRPYDRASGVFKGVRPFKNVGENGGLGAWEVAARYSFLNLNQGELPASARDVQDFTFGLNWHLCPNARVMWNYVHSWVDGSGVDSGVDVFLMRFQIAF